MGIYRYIKSKLSYKNKGRLNVVLFKLRLKPTVNKKIKSPFKKGIVVFSADFEMAWAYRFSKKNRGDAEMLGLRERSNINILLQLFEKYSIPVTWATVGHLFLEKCKPSIYGVSHSEMLRPCFFENRNWNFNEGDWYQHDPGTCVKKDPAWYAPDLIRQILLSKVGHEIGCHTFSHIDFSSQNCPKDLADSELDKCIELADEIGIKLKSMVFPGGTCGNFDSLIEKGLICYRRTMKYQLDLPHIRKDRLVEIPSTLGLDKDPYGWTKEFHLEMVRSFVANTAKYRLVCHFWFHPSLDPWYIENVLPDVLNLVSEFREQNSIKVITMSELAEEFAKAN